MNDSTTSDHSTRPVQMALTKECPVCKQALPPEDYNRNTRSKTGLAWACRECQRKDTRDRYSRDDRARQANTERSRRIRYGISPEQFDAMLVSQGGVCAICGGFPRWQKSWHVDHDHDTKTVRGILCPECNVALGSMRDNPARLRAAAEYLERHGK